MSAAGVEAVLARLYTDADFRSAFVSAPAQSCAGLDLTADEIAQLATIDRDGLELAAASLARKRTAPSRARHRRWWPLR